MSRARRPPLLPYAWCNLSDRDAARLSSPQRSKHGRRVADRHRGYAIGHRFRPRPAMDVSERSRPDGARPHRRRGARRSTAPPASRLAASRDCLVSGERPAQDCPSSAGRAPLQSPNEPPTRTPWPCRSAGPSYQRCSRSRRSRRSRRCRRRRQLRARLRQRDDVPFDHGSSVDARHTRIPFCADTTSTAVSVASAASAWTRARALRCRCCPS